MEDAAVERHGDAIYVVCVPNRAALAGYDLALSCLLRMENGLVLPPSRWLDAPVENTRQYKPIYRQISRVIQERLRELLPAIWFSYPNSFDSTSVSQAMLMYQASPSAAGHTRQTICRDLLSPHTLDGIFHVTRWTLPPVLADVHSKLKLAGHKRAVAFKPSLAQEIIERQRKLGSHGRTILLIEQEIINAMTTAGVYFGELMANKKLTAGQRRKIVCRISENLAFSIAAALGRFVRAKDRLGLTLTLMSEASRILERVTDLDEANPPCAA